MANRDDYIRMDGTVVDVLPGTKFIVKLDNDVDVTATISGKMRINNIRVLDGDRVTVDISTYDLSVGRIVRRL